MHGVPCVRWLPLFQNKKKGARLKHDVSATRRHYYFVYYCCFSDRMRTLTFRPSLRCARGQWMSDSGDRWNGIACDFAEERMDLTGKQLKGLSKC